MRRLLAFIAGHRSEKYGSGTTVASPGPKPKTRLQFYASSLPSGADGAVAAGEHGWVNSMLHRFQQYRGLNGFLTGIPRRRHDDGLTRPQVRCTRAGRANPRRGKANLMRCAVDYSLRRRLTIQRRHHTITQRPCLSVAFSLRRRSPSPPGELRAWLRAMTAPAAVTDVVGGGGFKFKTRPW